MEGKSGGVKEKEKKYVLYTVMNEDKQKAGVGVWAVRIILGSLLLIALAVVPYVSLRLAQANEKTLVVFQSVPQINRSRNHLPISSVHDSGNLSSPQILYSAALRKENNTKDPSIIKQELLNSTFLTLHESVVTISLLEENSNISLFVQNRSTENLSLDSQTITVKEETLNQTSIPTTRQTINVEEKTDDHTNSVETNSTKDSEIDNNLGTVSVKDNKAPIVTTNSMTESSTRPTKVPKSINITSRPIPKYSPTMIGITHNLAYVAAATSGNHVGGICVWKTNKNVTNWSYFYDNIPIEYQSRDITDREMRGLLVATRMWSSFWHDYHVVFRSQHPSIKGSNHLTRIQLVQELDKKSENHFTYELEWRLRKDDRLMSIAYSLARLFKNYDYWFKDFEQHVNDLLGVQDWSVEKDQSRVIIPYEYFKTDHRPESDGKVGDMETKSVY